MRDNFAAALSLVLKSEGGYSDDPADPGGATNMGITRPTLARWLRVARVPVAAVRALSRAVAGRIYKALYWDRCEADALPAGLDLAIFDFAVNSGVTRAAIYLQEIVGVAPDGKIGPLTLAAVAKENTTYLITKLCAMRLGFLKRLSTWPRFGNGWTNRVNAVEQAAMKMAGHKA